MLKTLFVIGFSAGMMVTAAEPAYAQNPSTRAGQAYPDRPIRIVTSEYGGSTDVAARLIAPELAAPLGQNVIVDNRGGTLPSTMVVSKALPDGYTLLVSTGFVWVLPFLQTVSFDPVRDFSPITLINIQPNILVVNSALAVKSVKELIALAKAKPASLNYASGGAGSSPHLAAELFNSMTGVKMTRINYKGSGPGLVALIAGEVQLSFPAVSSAVPHIKSGKVRALAVTSAQPSALFPDVPTVAAAGVPGYEFVQILGAWAPAKTPAPIISRLNREIVQILKKPDVKEKFLNTATEVVGSTAEQFAAVIKSDMARMGKVIKDAGIRVE